MYTYLEVSPVEYGEILNQHMLDQAASLLSKSD